MQKDVLLFSVQIKAGRTLLGWSQADLAERAGVARPTVARIELLTMQPRLDTASKLKQVLRDAGVEIVDHNEKGGFSLVVTSAFVDHLVATVNEKPVVT